MLNAASRERNRRFRYPNLRTSAIITAMATLHRELAPGAENLQARPNAARRLNFPAVRECLRQFEFGELFIEHLGWSNPPPGRRDGIPMAIDGLKLTRRHIADLAGVGVYEIESAAMPDSKTRAAIHKEISQLQYECLLIFVDSRHSITLLSSHRQKVLKFR